MRRLFASFLTLAMMTAAPAFAAMEDYPSVKLQGLDKSVGRTVTFEAKVGSTIQYGPLFIKINSCRKAPPIEKPESAAFLQIWEVPPGEKKSEWVFSGWMFASSPALSAMDHPVYDIWVLDCLGKEEPNEEAAQAETDEQADQSTLANPGEGGDTLQDGAASDPQAIPTDSEAEEDPASGPTPEPQIPADDAPSPDAPVPDAAAPADTTDGDSYAPEQAAPVTQAEPQDESGMTAYDYMRRQQQGAQAPAEQAPQNPSSPIY